LRVLNVGGGRDRDLPKFFRGWDQETLDIDPSVEPEICCDAKEMGKLPAGKYDAIYCSHMLEHFYKHDVPKVLAGFKHVLKDNGFANINVPDLMAAFKCGDIDDVWYRVSVGAVTFHDAIYGWDQVMKRGNLYFAHKCGFSEKSLAKALRSVGFTTIRTASDGFNIFSFAFKAKPSTAMLMRLGV
jgi:ubiquinone/menaquinone biosynthesis C-methylase UbiE